MSFDTCCTAFSASDNCSYIVVTEEWSGPHYSFGREYLVYPKGEDTARLRRDYEAVSRVPESWSWPTAWVLFEVPDGGGKLRTLQQGGATWTDPHSRILEWAKSRFEGGMLSPRGTHMQKSAVPPPAKVVEAAVSIPADLDNALDRELKHLRTKYGHEHWRLVDVKLAAYLSEDWCDDCDRTREAARADTRMC
jgi:hypothetical protein